MYYDGSQDFELEEDKLYVDFIIFTYAWIAHLHYHDYDMLMMLFIYFTDS